MDVLYCFDDGYARVVAVSMISYARFHRGSVFHMFTLNKIAEETYSEFERIAQKYDSEIFFYDVTEDLLKYKKLFKNRKLNLGMLARLLAAEKLPDNIETILYLDGDTLVLSSVDNNDLVIDDNYILGVYDISLPPMGVKKSLDLKEDDIYINSGVLLINLSLWRKERFDLKFYDFFKNHINVILWDQDAINYLCKGKIGLLPLSYNLTFIAHEVPYLVSTKLFEPYTYKYYTENDLREAQQSPKIIHFAGEVLGKPWTNVSYIKYTEEWREIDKETRWGQLPYFERKYANSNLKSKYKKTCEEIIANAYKRSNYRKVCRLYNLLYKIPHRLQAVMRR